MTRFALNTSTLKGHKLRLEQIVDIAAGAGYSGIEPWISELEPYGTSGASVSDLRARLSDKGLAIVNAIGFAEWVVDDDRRRAEGLERMRRDMDLVARLGGARIAAPPVGAHTTGGIAPERAAERYRTVLEIGDSVGVTPVLEVWGFSRLISRLGEALHVAAEARHPRASLLLDVYHLHKGGSGFDGLRLLGPSACGLFHLNDYPAEPARESLSDGHRVYPGDGVAPMAVIMDALRGVRFDGIWSLELFNESYWRQDPVTVARTGLAKMQAAVSRTGVRPAGGTQHEGDTR